MSLTAIAAAPLLAGGVHRPIMISLFCVSLVGLASLCVAVSLEGRPLRADFTLILPLAFLAIPLLQSIPLPYAARALLDRSGTALLIDNQPVATTAWPLSLDPPATRVAVGRAAAALAAFLFASHLAAGQRRRHLVLRAIGITGVLAVIIGLGHRIAGSEKLYGTLTVPVQSLLVGPFVNRNHTAELLELAAFVCLACALQRRALLNRSVWGIAAVLCAGGAAATLSRGAVLGLGVGVVVFAIPQYFGSAGREPGRRRSVVIWGAVVGGLVVVGMLALGADQLIGRFKADGVSTDLRFRLWRDGLHVLAVHPAGIGRGAFDRVFPIYRSLKMPYPMRFAFLENEPFQFLVDSGWLLFSLLLISFSIVVYRLARRGRRDVIETALCAGLAAVLAHGVVDFGLETLGVLLPFSAVAGTVFGRLRGHDVPAPPAGTPRLTWATAGLAGFGLLFGLVATAHASNDDFDALLRRTHDRAQEMALVERAERTHPLDYLYALDWARLVPLAGSPSPRLHALNRALRLCPSCETVHAEVARNLWTMRLRRQALLEWRTAVDIQPLLLRPLLGELFGQGARPEELAALAAGSPARLLEVVDFLAYRNRVADAFIVLDQADAMGAPRAEMLLSRASLSFDAGNLEAAATAAAAAAAAGAPGPKLPILQAQILLKQQDARGADQALAILDGAAARYPTDLALQRQRVSVVTRYQKWSSAARALDGLKLACYHATGSAAEAHVAAAAIASDMGRLTVALDEYRMALADQPNDVGIWMSYGHAAEAAGREVAARDAYSQAERLSPKDPVIMRALQILDQHVARLRAQDSAAPILPPPEP